MNLCRTRFALRFLLLSMTLIGGFLMVLAMLGFFKQASLGVLAAPIAPPEGYPKFILSTKTVTPTLASIGGAKLIYRIEIVNTGAYTGFNVLVTDPIPANTVFNQDAYASSSPAGLTFQGGVLSWQGSVGFDASVVITFSVNVSSTFSGVIANTAQISHAMLSQPILVSAQTMVTDEPLFEIDKRVAPEILGPNHVLTYTLSVTNRGQLAQNMPVTVTDVLPAHTSFLSAGVDGVYNPASNTLTWKRSLSLNIGEASQFTYQVLVGDVLSGTKIVNAQYEVESGSGEVVAGEVVTTTVIDPILFLYKETDPFPPGSNRQMVYTLTVFNKGSLATGLVVSDTIPSGVTYVSGGTLKGNVVTWNLPDLDRGDSARVSFVVSIGDVAEVPIVNDNYRVCSAEGGCQVGVPLTSIVKGAIFEAEASLDPIAKKTGGGSTETVTPTLVVRNLGPGNALDASIRVNFYRISVSLNDLLVISPQGELPKAGPPCGDKCSAFVWVGDIGIGEVVTITVPGGRSTIGGEEGTVYSTSVVVSDTQGSFSYPPVKAVAKGNITHFPNLIPSKTAPPVVGNGQVLTYTLEVFNSGFTTGVPPYPVLVDSVPTSVTLLSVSNGGAFSTVDGRTVVSWTLPAMGPGDALYRSYAVRVDPDLISGTLIVNDDYHTSFWENTIPLSITGQPITTVVREVGLVDSFKTVTPFFAPPGAGTLLTYTVHVVNSSPVPLNGVEVYDLLPWQVSTYQRDAQASAGQLSSDIVSVNWTGNVDAFSAELITFTVLVDPDYTGTVTNTAWINHSSLAQPVKVSALAYITDKPVLQISKSASPDPVRIGGELQYTLRVVNLGQQATRLVIVDTIPRNSAFIPYSANGNGQLSANQLRWDFPVLDTGESREFTFRVSVRGFKDITNENYSVTCAEGIEAIGEALVTKIAGVAKLFLPFTRR
jgi:uncharacterized repeat protein (TIGR01451 family)